MDTTRASRPNNVTNHGTPAAGMYTPRSNCGSSSRSASMSRTERRHVWTTVSFGASMPTPGSGGAIACGRVVRALQSSVGG